MKVMKFGGSSVATPDNIRRVKAIVTAQEEPAIVVVSALGGVTDELVRISALAEAADSAYQEHIRALRQRHIDACTDLVGDTESVYVVVPHGSLVS